MKRALLAGACALTLAGGAFAADHIDSPAAVNDPAADITDLFAWMTPEADKVNLIMNVTPFAGADAAFSTATQYVFHVNSAAGYGETQTETNVICQFYAENAIECWANGEYVIGDPSDPAGITSESGGLKVFAGLRNDPFFMEFAGFTQTVETVIGAAGDLAFDAAGCPAVDEATSAALVGLLQGVGTEAGMATDTFAGANVLSLVVQVDKTLVNGGGPILGIWGSTHSAPAP
ncbi:MAG: DUF4331 family protein [Bradymonadia bacterium]